MRKPVGLRQLLGIVNVGLALAVGCQPSPAWAASFVTEASWYSETSVRREGGSGITASGQPFDDTALTCAMRRRAFGKRYRVTNVETGKSVVVVHNDFGPNLRLWTRGRKIDLSRKAFEAICSLRNGICTVLVERLP